MEFLDRRHPEVRMRLELAIKPGGSSFLRAHAQEIGIWITGEAVKIFSVLVVAVTVTSVPVVTIAMVTVAGCEWPIQAHTAIFSIPDLKSKPGGKNAGADGLAT
jgi:hypothetical protein